MNTTSECEKTVYFSDSVLAAGQKYILKWYSHDDWMAPLLAQIDTPITVSSALHEEAKQLKKEIALDKIMVAKERKALEAQRIKQSSELMTEKLKLEEKARILESTAASAAVTANSKTPLLPKTMKYSDNILVSTSERKIFSRYFELIDTNKDDQITFWEMKAFMIGQGFHVTDDDIRLMMVEADTDESGTIDFDEFCKVCKRAENFKTTIGWRVAQARLGEEIHSAMRTNKGKRKLF